MFLFILYFELALLRGNLFARLCSLSQKVVFLTEAYLGGF